MDDTTRPDEQPEQAAPHPGADAPQPTPQPVGQPQPTPQPVGQPHPTPQPVGQPQPTPHPGPYAPQYPGQFAPQPLAPAPAPRQTPFKRGFGLGAGAGLGLGGALLVFSLIATLLGGLVMMGFAGAAGALAGGGQTSVEPLRTVWGSQTAKHKLRAIPIAGVIQTSGSDGLALQATTYGFEVADVLDGIETEDADGVVLMLNTPGGSGPAMYAMAEAIDRYRERTGKKVFAFVEDGSYSAGMYTMAGADEIVVDPFGGVGSIGVIMGPLERYRDVTGMGSLLTGEVTAREITQEYITAGRGKDAGQPFRDLTGDERAMLQDLVDEMYTKFVDHVSTKRGIDRATIVDTLGAGIFGAQKAKEIGYVDDVMGRDDAFRHFATVAGLDPADTKLVQATAPGLWATLLGAEARAWGTGPAAQPAAGQPARATAKLCTEAMPLALHGTLAGVCG